MISIGQTQQIGQKLIRSFGTGKNLRHVITETRGNNTITQILDFEGKVIKNRAKSVSRAKIGDKIVVTKKYGDSLEKLYKTSDRVYDSSGNFLGQRLTIAYPCGEKSVNKIYKGGNHIRKDFMDGIVQEKHIYSNEFRDGHGIIKYNNLGLPIPEGLSEVDNLSLQEMLKLVKLDPVKAYHFPEGSGLEHIKLVCDSKFNPLEYASKLNFFA